MFKRKKIQKEIEKLELEKKELLFIKEQLDVSTPKIDISNIYVWKDKGLCSIVRLDVQKFCGRNWGGAGKEVDGYFSTLTDVFSNNIVYQKSSTEIIQRKQYISGKTLSDGYYAFLLPLHEADNNLLAYANKQVPLYVLQQLFYRLNNVDANAHELKKQK